MDGWAAKAQAWFGIAEQKVASLLHLVGQDNEVLAFGIVVLGLLLALLLTWAVLLGVLHGFLGLFGGGGGGRKAAPQGPDLRDAGFAPVMLRDAPGRLDVIPSVAPALSVPVSPEQEWAMAAADRQQMALMGKPGKAPMAKESGVVEPSAPAAASKSKALKSDPRLAQAAGALPAPGPSATPRGAIQRIKVKHLPEPAQRGAVVSARPEWTGKVVPSSLEEAGAVEVCRVLSRRATAPGNAAPVRAVDYRVCGLPRVDGEGHRQPDVLVYTVADRGFLPKGMTPKTTKRPAK
jgi:hypothetical protein